MIDKHLPCLSDQEILAAALCLLIEKDFLEKEAR